MLNFLPNELLCKIFKKVDESTARNCRLLNSRINNVIEREEVHKKKLTELNIYGDESQILLIKFNDEKLKLLDKETFEEEWKALLSEFCNSPKMTVQLHSIHINKQFLTTVMGHKCLRKVNYIHLYKCTYDDDGFDEMLRMIPMMKLASIGIEPHEGEKRQIPQNVVEKAVKIPDLGIIEKQLRILNHVTRYFECSIDRSRIDFPDFTHFTDELLDTWVGCSKTLRLDRCRTGFTLNGIVKRLESCLMNNIAIPFFNLGILESASATEVERTFPSYRDINHQAVDGATEVTYQIEEFNGKSCWFQFSILERNQ